MADIFLSYARENSEIAKLLSERLEHLGWSVWWDWEVPAGQNWRDMIEQSLASMRCMIVLWSMDSIDSDWVKEEAEKGKAQRKLVAALIDEVNPPMGFRDLQAANLIGWDGSLDFPGFGNLIDALEAQLGKPVKIPAAEPAPASEVDAARGRQEIPPARFDSSELCHIANRLPWRSYAKAIVLLIILIAGSIERQERAPGTTSPASLPVTTLDAREMPPSPPLTIRGPTIAPPAQAQTPKFAPPSVTDHSRHLLPERKPAKRIDESRPRNAAIPNTAPSAHPCSEIFAGAQLGAALADGDRETLRKDCSS
ncbi:MAG TPA: toll/interleukin-1 receptor domain-containing protein [Candidatus Deferrimicrobium sp.]|nr:toll/interleukin-1 receptor domain-containing protein [Candidatus Deferrimicrobium sp.]